MIEPNVIATAAHCVHNKVASKLKVRAGEWDTQTRSESYPHQDGQVKSIVVHPDYSLENTKNDIALLFLEIPFELAENVKPICLPSKSDTFNGQRCFASGWGKDKLGRDGRYSVVMKRIELPIISNDVCEVSLKNTTLGEEFTLHHSTICAGGEIGPDTCKGDDGSPLACEIKESHGRYYLSGIVSWGLKCGDGVPRVYVNVPLFREWIDDEIQKNHQLTNE